MRGGTLYVEDEDAPEARSTERGPRASTVLTALLVALGLALPGVAAFLLRPREASQGAGAPARPASTHGTRLATEPAPAQQLARLEPGLVTPARTGPPASGIHDDALRSILDDPDRPAEERSEAALELLDSTFTRGRTRVLARDAERIFRMDLPRHLGRLPAEQAGWHWVNALNMMDERARVPEAGEAFLRRFPDSTLAPTVNTVMRSAATMLASEQRARQRMKEHLQSLEVELESERLRLESRGEPTTRVRFELARKRCSEPASNRFHDVSVVACRAFLDAWSPGTTPAERIVLRDARVSEIAALVGLRRYAEARARLAEFRAADPEGERQTIAASVVDTIPADAED